MDVSRIKDFLNDNDLFCRANGIRLIEIRPGYAEAELVVSNDSLKSRGVVQGGAIFTLADFAFAGAANAGNVGCVSQNVNLTFVRPGMPPKLRAVAKEIRRGRQTGLYQVEVFGSDGKLTAYATVNGFSSGEEFLPEK